MSENIKNESKEKENFKLFNSIYLSKNFFETQFKGISAEHLHKFEDALASVERWQDKYADKYMEKENLLDHVQGMLDLVNYLEKNYPKISLALSMNDLRLMIIVHDFGETLRGDVPLIEQNNKDRPKQKYFEGLWAQRLIRIIENEDLRKRISNLYDRQHHKSPGDFEAHIMKLIDVNQGNMFGAEHIFQVRRNHNFGYKSCGSNRKPEYFINLCKNVVYAAPKDKEVLNGIIKFFNNTLFATLDTFYPKEDVVDIREEVEKEIKNIAP